MNKLFVPFLPPWVETGLQPAFYDKESGTVLQQTARMYDKVNQLIRNFNDLSKETKETVEEYILKFTELKDFVDDYFDNLDVQEEINNKLNQMVEDGTLEEILSQYIDENVVRKDTYATSETGGAVKVGNTLTIDENGVLNEASFLNYLPIETHVTRYHGTGGYTTVYYAIIDSDYKPDLTLANDTVNTVQQSGDNALDNKSTLTVNAGLFNTSTGTTTGTIIKNGEIVKLNDSMGNDREILYMTSDGTLHSVTDNTSADQLITLGAVWAVQGWYPFVKDGVDLTSGRTPTDYQPRSVIGQDSDGRYIIMVNMGRSLEEAGMSAVDCLNFCTSVGFTPYFLYNLDGGASINFVDRGIRLNGLVDGTSRKVANFITWASKTAKNNGTFNVANATYHKNIQRSRKNIPLNVTSKLSYNSDITVDTTTNVKVYNDSLVVGYFRFTNTATIAGYTHLIDNIPALPQNVSDESFLAFSTAGVAKPCYITRTGSLSVSGGYNGLEAGTWFISFVYSTDAGRTDTSTPE